MNKKAEGTYSCQIALGVLCAMIGVLSNIAAGYAFEAVVGKTAPVYEQVSACKVEYNFFDYYDAVFEECTSVKIGVGKKRKKIICKKIASATSSRLYR